MKKLMLLTIFSLTFLACNEGPQIPTCVVLNDLVTENCTPFDSSKPDYKRPVKAGDYALNALDKAALNRWIEDHKAKSKN